MSGCFRYLRPPSFILLAALSLCLSCGKPDPGGVDVDGDGIADGVDCRTRPAYTEDVSTCDGQATDYRPRDNGSASDSWPACISDDNVYHPIQGTVSSIARVEAFEQIVAKLLEPGRAPGAQDFLDARVLYAQDQGLDSRVQRREDIHYPAPDGGARCSDLGIPEAYPDRCVGPAKLLPILNDSFAQGGALQKPLIQAARIEAALLWFLYVSALSEVTSCATRAQDCDSAWAYYSGGTPRDTPLGLARYIAALGPETHQRAYDGVLAARCWRNLDNETGTAVNLALRDQARDQLDRAMLRGVALIARQRFAHLTCSTGQVQDAHFAFLKVVVPLLDRATRERDAAAADVLAAQVARERAGDVDVTAAVAALDRAYPCP